MCYILYRTEIESVESVFIYQYSSTYVVFLFEYARWCYMFGYIDYLSLIVGSLYLDKVVTTMGAVTMPYQAAGPRPVDKTLST